MHVPYRSHTVLKRLSFYVEMMRGENSYRFLLKGQTYIRVGRREGVHSFDNEYERSKTDWNL